LGVIVRGGHGVGAWFGFSYKRIIGDPLRSRSSDGQRIQALIGANILNRMTVLGMPESVALGG
jgi:hypothetical protein